MHPAFNAPESAFAPESSAIFTLPSMAPEPVPTYGPFDLKSATVLITGGSSGIGLGLAEEFLKAGSTVIITGRRESALRDAQKKSPKLHTYVNDASKVEDREELSRWVVEHHPEVNVLVNNAGIQRSGPLSKEPEDWSVRQSEIAINVEAPVHLMQLLSPHFLKQKEAAIINISSGLAFIPCGFAPGLWLGLTCVASYYISCQLHSSTTR